MCTFALILGDSMVRRIKKYLSYTLGIVLALGIGLSYAYAVSANDTNTFVTKQEWQEKMAMLNTAIDNVSKTINDTNLDYVMHGPRLQTSFFDGFDKVSVTNGGYVNFVTPYREPTLSSIYNLYPRFNNVILHDLWNGHQSINNYYYSTGDISAAQLVLKARFAVKTDMPGIYLVVSIFDGSTGSTDSDSQCYAAMFTYVVLGDLTEFPYTNARTITVTLPLNEWWSFSGTTGPKTRARTSEAVWYSTGGSNIFVSRMQRGSNNYDGGWTSGGFVTVAVTPMSVSYTFEFPAGAHTLKQSSTNSPWCYWNILPLNMQDRRFGGPYDSVFVPSSAAETTQSQVVKIYSPQKGCLALKSYLNGEIPILNE